MLRDVVSMSNNISLPADSDPATLLDQGYLDVYAQQGIETLDLPIPLDLRSGGQGARAARTNLLWLLVIREATRRGMTVGWELGQFDGVVENLAHFPPPRRGSLAHDIQQSWDARFVYGTLYWRSGGSFIQIKDRRADHQQKLLFTLDEPEQVAMFESLTSVIDMSHQNVEVLEFLDDMLELGLVIQCENFAMLLPYRMTHWPVPNVMI